MKRAQDETIHRPRRRQDRKPAKFGLLLPLILLTLIVFGFQDYHPYIGQVNRWLIAFTLVFALYASGVGRSYLLAVASVVFAATVGWKYARVYHGWIEIVVVATFTMLIALAPAAILRKVQKESAEEGVDAEAVMGALCAYVYIGSWFSVLYSSLMLLSKSPFFAQPGADNMPNLIYFSFITLTSTGFGDLSPAYGPGRMLAAIEAVIGQLYLVTVVGLVINAYRKR